MSKPTDKEILTLFPYEWVVKDKYTDDESLAIHVWCLDRDSKPHFLRIENFPVLCYVELPTIVWGQNYKWNQYKANKMYEYLCFRLGDDAPIGSKLRFLKKTYYYRGDITYPMLQLRFKTLDALRHCENLLNYPLKTRMFGTIRCSIWETKIPVIRKLLTNQNMSYSQWFTVSATPVEDDLRISTTNKEYIAEWRTMRAVPSEICDAYRIYPRILSWDIECYSDDKRVFPNEWCAKHVVYMISCIYQIYNHLDTRKRYAIILGSCAEIPASRLRDTEIIHVSSEYELVQAFASLILKLDPEILTGYNIFAFDYKYLHVRLVQKLYEWPMMGRLPDEKTVMHDQEWSSGAYGHNIVYDLKMDGRINVDLLPIIKRDYKLLKYTLDFVAEHFINAHKHDITAPDMFWIYEELQAAEKEFVSISCDESTTVTLKKLAKELEVLFQPCLCQKKTDVFNLYLHRHDIVCEGYKKYTRGWRYSNAVDGYKCTFIDFKAVFELIDANKDFLTENSIDLAVLIRYVLAQILMTFVLMYCIQDSELVLDLIEKLNVFVGLVEMSSVCGVTIVELFTRGQQLRCMSLLYDIAVKQGFVIDQGAKPGYSYKGGFVYPPTPGLHDNVMCWDFSSLYPTIIMAYNIDHTTLVHSDVEHLVPDELCNVIIFEQEEEEILEPENEGEKPKKQMVTRKYRFKYLNAEKSGRKGLIPQLEHKLVAERRAVRARIKTEKDPIMCIVYEQRQKSIKVVCNSFYGFLGVKNGGMMPLIEGAMSITAKARESILKVSSYIEDKHHGKVVYGDSVTGDTPIICRETLKDGSKIIKIVPISQLYTSTWEKDEKSGKDYGVEVKNLEVWSDKGFTAIKHIMRHKTSKRIYRITAHTGAVKVTADHSLLNEEAEEVKPCDVHCGDRLLTRTLPILPDNGIKIPDAWVWGLFYGDGSCGQYSCPSGIKYSWAINNQNLDYLERAKRLLVEAYPKNHFKILDTMRSSNVYKLVAGGDVSNLVKKWRNLFYDPITRNKRVPNTLWSASKISRQAFYEGYYAADGDKDKNGYNRFDNKGQIGSAGLFFLSRSLGYKVSCNTRKDKLDIYRLTLTTNAQRKPPGIIKKIDDLGFVDDYVYDLETANHHFSAGVGELVVHNTDSVMASLDIKDPMEAIRVGKKLEKELSDLFPDPMQMELEKVMRILSLKKKRYVYAMLDWKTGELRLDPKDLQVKGIEMARRDRPKWLTDLQLAVIMKIMFLRPFDEALELVFEAVDRLLEGKVDYRKLITVKGLGASYKSKSAEMAVFAEELKKLGKPAQPGSRLEFLVVEGDKDELKGRRMRLPETYLERLGTEKEEKLDYMYYIDQLTNPIGQLLTIGYQDAVAKLDGIIKFRPTKRHKFVGFKEPILLLHRMIAADQDYHILRGAVNHTLYQPQRSQRPRLIIRKSVAET